jgi:hypothetical protein
VDGSGTVDPELLVLALESNDDVTLAWGPSCNPNDDNYGIYRGTLGAFTSHEDVICSTGGLTTATLLAAEGDHYYLVVPNDGVHEGSYGTDSAGNPRLPGARSCFNQVVAVCP